MKPEQAAGYIFEKEIFDLLKESGFVNVTTGDLPGRGTTHQIDAYGTFSIPTPFTYPIRIIAEAKCYEGSIDLPQIRSFFGVITDISENYIVGEGRKRNTSDRYSDTGCFFSANSFTAGAQDFAWAHNIFLISFSGNAGMKLIVRNIRRFTDSLTDEDWMEIAKNKGTQKEDLFKKCQNWKDFQSKKRINWLERYPSLLVGIIDEIYPVIIVGNRDWYKYFNFSSKTDVVEGKKTNRFDLEDGSLFELYINDKSEDNPKSADISFTIPDVIAGKIKDRINQKKGGDEIFDLDIPLLIGHEKETTRRIIKIKVRLADEDKKEYYQKIIGLTEEKNDSKKPRNPFRRFVYKLFFKDV
jgi:hypothetical protein